MRMLTVRLTDAEHAAMKAICEHEILPVSSYIRRHIRQRAAELGVLSTATSAPTKPALAGAALSKALDDIIFDDEPQEN